MSDYKLITDSSSDIPESILKEYNITHLVVGSDSLFNLIKPKTSFFHHKSILVINLPQS